MGPGDAVDAIGRGYREASSAERSSFLILSSFATTIGIARAITYTQERRRALPLIRSLGRRAWAAQPTRGLRVHHFLPGIGIAFAAGGAAIITRTERVELWFSVPFGVGSALTVDELALLVKADNPYWRSERLALIQAAAAGLGAAALRARFIRRGRA